MELAWLLTNGCENGAFPRLFWLLLYAVGWGICRIFGDGWDKGNCWVCCPLIKRFEIVREGLLKIFDFCGLGCSYLGSEGRSPSLLLLLVPIKS